LSQYDVAIRHGKVYDGSGNAPILADVTIKGDTISSVGTSENASAKTEIDGSGLAVAPGFVNVLSWGAESLIEDGRAESDIRQGVTLEVFGEGESMGPLTEDMKKYMVERQGDVRYEIEWTTLGEYLDYLVRRGVSPNVASFVGAATVRVNVLGFADRPPSPLELKKMRQLVCQAMEEGALGVGAALIYAPGFYAKTDELVALAQAAGEYGGMYISHLRSEGNRLLEALNELITISREAKVPAEVYHMKAVGKSNWNKFDLMIKKIEAERENGMRITADMYPYIAGMTGLDAAMPPWVQEGGLRAWIERLKNPDTRERVKGEMSKPTDEWENLYLAAGPENMLLVAFRSDVLKPLTGKPLAQVAKLRGKSPEDTAMDLVIEDHSRVETVYFMMSEENVRRCVSLPWVSFGSDERCLTPEGVFMKSSAHPRAYGTFARVLSKYVRDGKVVPLAEAVRRLASLPSENFKLHRRGLIKPGYFADIVVFDLARIQDHATFENPHQHSTGMAHVFVNGIQVLKDGEHTGAKPGRVLRGPGWKGVKSLSQGSISV